MTYSSVHIAAVHKRALHRADEGDFALVVDLAEDAFEHFLL